MTATTVHSPIDGRVLATVDDTPVDDLDAVVADARRAQQEWAARPATERGRILHELAGRLAEHADELAELETRNTGKPPVDTRREVARAAASFTYFGGWADKVAGSTLPVPGDLHTYTLREPVGVVAGVIPWNVPCFFAVKKIAPALAFGNACVLKPAAETPLTALRLAELLAEADLPDGLVRVVTGGAPAGAALVGHPGVDLIVFTGSHETGRRVAAAAAEHLTPTVMELGGKSPQLVFADADLDAALENVLLGVFGAAGQMCIAGSRVYVQERVAEEFLGCLRDRVRALRVGDPRVDGIQVGPLVTATQRDKVHDHLARAQADGARVAARAAMPDDPALAGGYYAPPTVFDRVDADMAIMREEVFGPVVAVDTFRDDEDALARAHETEFGLAAGVWTSDIGRAHRLARDLAVGTVWVNTYRVMSDLVPFGGVGSSGYGRENGHEAVTAYTREKSVWTSLRPGLPAGYRLGAARTGQA